VGKCLASTDGCDCLTLMEKGREANQAPPNDPVPIPPNYGRFYALRSKEDKGDLPDEGTGMLIIPYRCKYFIKIPMLFSIFSC